MRIFCASKRSLLRYTGNVVGDLALYPRNEVSLRCVGGVSRIDGSPDFTNVLSLREAGPCVDNLSSLREVAVDGAPATAVSFFSKSDACGILSISIA